MNKLQALNWLVENVTRWPATKGGVVSSPKGWLWGKFCDGEIKLYKVKPTEMYADCHVTQGEWLNPASITTKANPKKIYIAGPMTGYDNFNRETFNKAAELLKAKDHIALNPAILPDGLTQPEYMQICIAMLNMCDGIVLLKGWEKSKGAVAEHALAFKLGLDVFEDK